MGHTVPLFPIRESSDPSNIIQPSFDPVNQRVESENQPNEVSNVPSQNGKAKDEEIKRKEARARDR